MALHIKRSQNFHHESVSSANGARISRWQPPAAGKSVLEIQHYPKPTVLQNVPDSKNNLTPPYHWHWYQEEHFKIISGRWIFTLEGVETKASANDPQPIVIPVALRHTFKVDPTCEEPATIEISTKVSPHAKNGADEDESGITEGFFRNLYSYLDDCEAQGVSPSLPQLLLFLHNAEVSLAFPGPRWIANPVSYWFGVLLGVVVGEYILGYKRSYPEYYDRSKSTAKKTK